MSISPRTGCLITLGFGLILAVMLWSAFLLAIRGELAIQTSDLAGYRLWLLNSDNGPGIGFSRAHPSDAGMMDGEQCIETVTDFYIWGSKSSEPQQVYCECFARVEGGWAYRGTCES